VQNITKLSHPIQTGTWPGFLIWGANFCWSERINYLQRAEYRPNIQLVNYNIEKAKKISPSPKGLHFVWGKGLYYCLGMGLSTPSPCLATFLPPKTLEKKLPTKKTQNNKCMWILSKNNDVHNWCTVSTQSCVNVCGYWARTTTYTTDVQ